MIVYPAIDLVGGKCVRLTQGDFNRMKVYKKHPVVVAKEFEDANLEYLHLVDLDGAKKGTVVNWKIIESIQEKTALKVDFGGGVKTEEEVDKLLELGVNQINIGSLAVMHSDIFISWIRKFGAENFILSADVIDEIVQIQGWTKPSTISLFDLVSKFEDEGLKFLSCTDVKTDGMLAGPNYGLYRKLKKKFPKLKIIASGGVQSLVDLKELNYLKLHGAVVGKAIYENKIKLSEIRKIL